MMRIDKRGRRWWILSVILHLALAAVLANIMFDYPLGQLMGSRPKLKPERILYIVVPPAPTEASGSGEQQDAGGAPAPLAPPTEVPATIPPAAVDSGPSQAAGGTGSGRGVGGSGVATGIVPLQPDPRIALLPGPVAHIPRTLSEDVDSIVSIAIGIYNDSMAVIAGRRQPGDWTVKDKDGKVWGWDKAGIRLGKVTIPNALLALLPLNMTSGQSPIDARNAAWVRRDIMENAQRTLAEDELRAAVKRIRARKDRERAERKAAEPIIP